MFSKPKVVSCFVVFASMLPLTPGCQQSQRRSSEPAGQSLSQLKAIDPLALDVALRSYLDAFFTRIVAAAGDASAGGAPREVREAALKLRIHTAEIIESLREPRDARSLFVYTWLAVAGLRQELTSGEFSRLFGDRRQKLVETIQSLESDLLTIARQHFPPALIEQSEDDIERAAAARTSLATRGATAAVTAEADLMAVLKIPLLPVSTLQGVSSTPESIDRFAESVKGVGKSVVGLPERFRWEAELLQWELAEDGPVADLLTGINKANDSIAQAVEVARQTPDKVGDRVDQSIRGMSKDLPAWNEFSSNIKSATNEIRQTAAELTPMAESWKSTAAEIRLLAGDIREMQTSASPRDPNRPPTDYANVATSAREAAAEMRLLVADLRNQNANQQLITAFETAGNRLIRTAFVYGAVLVGLIGATLWFVRRRTSTLARGV